MSPYMSPPPTTTQPRGIGKTIALISAGVSLTCAILTLGVAFWFWKSYGIAHVYTSSLLATTFFFVSATVVLHGMSKRQPPLPPEEKTT